MSDKAAASHSVDTVTQWVTFRLGAEKYGVNVMHVKEVLRESEIAPVPGAPDFVLGIINLRGNVVTVIDTRKRFALEEKEPDDATRIVIIEMDDQVVGMQVDAVAEVLDIADSQVELAPNVGNDESSKYIQGVSQQDNELVILVGLEKLLRAESSWAAD